MVTQIIDRKTFGIPGATGDVTPAALEARDQAVAARDEAEAARDEAEVFSAGTEELQDGAVAALFAQATSQSRMVAAGVFAGVQRLPEGFFTALDQRADAPTVCALLSDSTMDQTNEGMYLALALQLPLLYPERPLVGRVWNKSLDAYGSPIDMYTPPPGEVDPAAVVFSDDFTGDGDLNGRSAIIGGAWTTTGAYATSGGKAISSSSQQFAIGPAVALETQAATVTGRVSSATGIPVPNGVQLHLGINYSNSVRILWQGQSVITVKLQTQIADVVTDLADFTTHPWSASPTETDFAISISADGAVSATLGAETVTATLSPSDLNAVLPPAGSVRFTARVGGNLSPVWSMDNVQITAQRTEAITVLPEVRFYHGGAAGETLDSYHLAHLADMVPERPHLLLINMGHNYGAGVTPAQVVASFETTIAALEALYPGDPIRVAVTTQNPRSDSSGAAVRQRERMSYLRDYARARGWGVIPTYEAFAALPDGGASEIPDGIHPGIGTGRYRQRDTIAAWLTAQTERPT